MLATALLSLLFQAADGAPPHGGPPAANCRWCSQNIAPAAKLPPWSPLNEEAEFIRRFNGLAGALADFAETYNSQRVIDVKKVKAIRKTMRELEKSDWFNPKHESR